MDTTRILDPHIQRALDRLFIAIDTGQDMADIMRANERAAGYVVVKPGDVPWLPIEDWEPSIVVSMLGNRVRLVALLARHPGNGSFRRLLASLDSLGFEPAVVEPTREMRATLVRRGWKGRVVGGGIDRQEVWHPRRASRSKRP